MPKAPRETDAIDPQRDRLYRWEDTWVQWNYNSLTLGQCRKFIDTACRYYKTPTPRVVQHKTRSMSFCIPKKNYISLRGGKRFTLGGLNIPTALHEAAHQIIWHRHGNRAQDHGRLFLRVYLDLLARAGVAPRVALEASAKASRLKWR